MEQRRFGNSGLSVSVLSFGTMTIGARGERFGKPGKIAALTVYLGSDESAFTTRTTHIIDGGWIGETSLRPEVRRSAPRVRKYRESFLLRWSRRFCCRIPLDVFSQFVLTAAYLLRSHSIHGSGQPQELGS